MAKQSVTKTLKVSAKGILNIDGDKISIEVEDVGTFSLKKLLKPFDGTSVKFACTYDEDQEAPDYEDPDVDIETGEIIN